MTRTRTYDPSWTQPRRYQSGTAGASASTILVIGSAVGLSILVTLFSTISAVFVGAAHILDRL